MDSKGSRGLSPGDDRRRQGDLFKVGKSKPRRFGVKEVLAHDDQLTSLAHALMTHEQLDRTQFEELLQKEGWAEF